MILYLKLEGRQRERVLKAIVAAVNALEQCHIIPRILAESANLTATSALIRHQDSRLRLLKNLHKPQNHDSR